MPPAAAILAAALLAGGFYGGRYVAIETNKHVVKPAYHHVIKPVGCATEKVFTLGHKKCEKENATTPESTK